MTIGEIILKKPEVIPKLMLMGMGCVGCHMSQFETLRQGAEAHGIDIKELLAELNKD
jgi:hybrid cluster-associated redox disulfide protein